MSTELNTAKQQPIVHQPDTGADSLMRIIDRAAQSPDFDVEKLSRLLEMKERWEATEARKAFVAALNAFKADPPRLKKDKHVEYDARGGTTSYDHASLDHVSSEIGEYLARHGISHRWETEQQDAGQIRVTCVLTHEQGHSERTPLQAGADQSGGKNNIQAIGSTVTYLQRYTLLAATGMAVGGMDDDGRGTEQPPAAETITDAQASTLCDLLAASGVSEGKLLGFVFPVGNPANLQIEDIPADMYERCVQKLNTVIERHKEGGK